MVIKGGVIAWANMGDPNASIPTPEPVEFIFLYLFVLSHSGIHGKLTGTQHFIDTTYFLLGWK